MPQQTPIQKRKNASPRKITLTKEKRSELIAEEKKTKNPRVIERIHIILLKDKGWTHEGIAEHLGIGVGTVSAWVECYAEKGKSGILAWGYRGKKPRMSSEQMEIVRKRVKEKPFSIAQEAVDFIKNTFHIAYHPQYVPRLLKKIVFPTNSLV